MKTVSALVVALVVVIGMAPVGVAAASSGDASSSGALSAGVAQINETATATPANGSTETATPTANETAEENTSDTNGSTSDIEPGAQLAGVVSVQGTEVSEEVGSRAFGLRVAAAASNESKATVVANELNATQERLETLRDRRAELEQAYEAGELSEGQYRARVAGLSAKINAIDRRLNQTNESASSLPAEVRERKGINTSNIERLRTEASNLSGPETAAIARGIAGRNAGRGLGTAGGGPGQAGNAPERNGSPGNGTDGVTGAGANVSTGNSAGGPGNASNGEAAGGPTNASDAGAAGASGGEAPGGNGSEDRNTSREGGGSGSGPTDGGSGNGNGGDGGPPDNPGNSDNGEAGENAAVND
ncbi:DUF7096 domain-containing protein [Halobellus ordinarius]|uniref:DUF7096 domain-containing protein n=1 Tax=Halobellus ordinarius TaxID=3075120 RepID=UPI00288038CF|nr:hypothetical protein [Halobellus sp. ZY16]